MSRDTLQTVVTTLTGKDRTVTDGSARSDDLQLTKGMAPLDALTGVFPHHRDVYPAVLQRHHRAPMVL